MLGNIQFSNHCQEMFNVYISVYYDIEHVIKYRKETIIAIILDHSTRTVKNETLILDWRCIKD